MKRFPSLVFRWKGLHSSKSSPYHPSPTIRSHQIKAGEINTSSYLRAVRGQAIVTRIGVWSVHDLGASIVRIVSRSTENQVIARDENCLRKVDCAWMINR